MNPHQKNKIDVGTLSPEEQRLFRLYGKLPSQPSIFARNNQRKYFDSGDYALNKAGKGDGVDNGNVGSIVPDVDTIRHASTPTVHPAGSGAAGSSSSVPTLSSPGLAKSGSGSLHQAGGGLPSSGIPVGSPAKESSLQRETSVEEAAAEDDGDAADGQGIPIRS